MGLFQNIKQTLSGIAYFLISDPNGNTVGQNGSGNSLNVFQTNVVNAPATTGSVLSQLSITTTSSTSLLASNTNRRGFSVYNNSSNFVFVAMSSVAATGAFSVALQPNGYEEIPSALYPYTGSISYISSATGGNLQVTEFTT